MIELGTVLVTVLVTVGIFGIIFCILILIRNELIYKIRVRAIKVASNKAKYIIDNGSEGMDWIEEYNKRDSFGSYYQMLWDFRKWKYEHFYPNWTFDENNSSEYK